MGKIFMWQDDTATVRFLNGLTGSGQKNKALEMAARSAEHPAFKQKAEELASGIK